MTTIIILALAVLFSIFVLPNLPKWAKVCFWTGFCLYQIIQGDALFAALSAAFAVDEAHEP